MSVFVLFFLTLFLAYANGANDNFKGVATLYGSRTLSYRTAIQMATLATFAGSISSIFLAQGLVAGFSGKGLIPDQVVGAPIFLMSVGFGAAATVLLATRLGFPISTTHSLVGGLLGAGIMAVGWDVHFHRLGETFLIPLLMSPLIAFTLAVISYRFFSYVKSAGGFSKESCICVGEQKNFVPLRVLKHSKNDHLDQNIAMDNPPYLDIAFTVADTNECMDLYTNRVWGISVQKLLDLAHVFSAAMVSFARGLNDTPKIAGLLVASQALDIQWGMTAIASGMAVGGVFNARKVAETISHNITVLTQGQGFSANLITGFLVIVASKFGVPVSTTHVSVGAIMGIGMVSGNRNANMIVQIILSWLVTLPIAMGLSAALYFILS